MNSPKIIYEDESVLVINKPAGYIVNNAETTKGQPTVQDWLIENKKSAIVNDMQLRSGIVHRLDKETSGILIIAKTKEAFEKLQSEFKEREVKKTYTALVHGRIEKDKGEIEASVGRLPWRRDRFGVLPGGREASTSYKVLKRLSMESEEFTLLELYPKTGRTHQIRIHLKYINHPIVGDTFYAGRKTARKDRVWCPRLFLHAHKIVFIHPVSGKPVALEAPLAEDLSTALHLFTNTLV